jgi:diguanylate cyclase (GGDEF)-like protein
LVLAFIDVDGLKATNDAFGHAAGDQLLQNVVSALRAHLRDYDLVVRFGGDEFVCALMDLDMAQATERFGVISADLSSSQASLTVGLAELQQDDSLAELIARADDALYEERKRRSSARA